MGWPEAHSTFLFFGFSANLIVTSMLILGGGATINALTGMDTILASFLIPISVIPYTMYGGLKATFLASYIHTSIIFVVLLMMIYTIYVSEFSSNQIWTMIKETSSYTEEECRHIFSEDFVQGTGSRHTRCGPLCRTKTRTRRHRANSSSTARRSRSWLSASTRTTARSSSRAAASWATRAWIRTLRATAPPLPWRRDRVERRSPEHLNI